MKMYLYTVKDMVSGSCSTPFAAHTRDEAKRMFKVDYENCLKNASSSPFAMFIEDYQLCEVGTFDPLTGIVSGSGCVLIFSGKNLLPSDVVDAV